jgi:KaiC/GvpD/RAD55 family RecA-like ATPase
MSEKEPLVPKLFGFEDLLIPSGKGGIPFGSTLLLSGPPGAGKTTFALAVAGGIIRNGNYIIYYISSEINLEKLQKVFKSMGWFPEANRTEETLFKVGSQQPDTDTFYTIVPEPDVDRPVPSPEELVNSVFNRLARTLSPGEAPRESANIIVIVDSVTAILKGATTSDERRQTHEILHRLRSLFTEEQLALIILIAEQDLLPAAEKPETCVEDYLSEIVFHLYHKALVLGRRVRVLEIIKSQGVNLLSGEHTWQIVTNENCHKIFPDARLQKHVEDTYGKVTPGEDTPGHAATGSKHPAGKWGTVAIFTRPKLYLTPAPCGGEPICTGTSGLDKLLSASANEKGGLLPGTTTLIAGPLGSGKSTLCIQFLIEDALSESSKCGKPPHYPNVLISFDLAAKQTVDQAWKAAKADKLGERDAWISVLDFTQSEFDFNRLLAHVQRACQQGPPKRIAFDGLSEWLTTFEHSEAARMLEALTAVVASKNDSKPDQERPTVFMTYELALSSPPLAPQTVGVSADNIVAVRQINIHDEIRRVIYVLKSTATDSDKTVRELVLEGKRLEVRPSLDSFTGILEGTPLRAEALLQLFRENEAEREFNRWVVDRLNHTRDLRFKDLDFSRPEIGRLLEDTDSQTRFPPADIKILSVDEWWLSRSDLRGGQTGPKHPLLDLKTEFGQEYKDTQDFNLAQSKALATSWSDFWLFEQDKTGPKEGQFERYAVPGHMDYGMMCVNPAMLKDRDDLSLDVKDHLGQLYKVDREMEPKDRIRRLTSLWNFLLHDVPRTWVRKIEFADGFWFDDSPDQATMVGRMKQWGGSGGRGFSFDMMTRETCVCTFFELSWAFGEPENFLAGSGAINIAERPCTRALEFLQFLVLEGLMPERSSVETTARTFFSRHFYSTMQEVAEIEAARQPKDGSREKTVSVREISLRRPPPLIALPFFPLGTEECAEKILVQDIVCRLKRLAGRVDNLDSRFKDTINPVLNPAIAELSRMDADIAQSKQRLLTLTEELRLKLLNFSGAVPGAADIIEIAHWHMLRLKLLCGGTKQTTSDLDAVLQAFDQDPFATASLTGKPILTGYGCTGSWLYGVHRATRSPSLARDILEELTSLEAAEQRATLGAGMSARRDFCELHGSDLVPGMEYFSWLTFLRYNCSRARRRERVLPPGINPADVYKTIHEQILACLGAAAFWRREYIREKRSVVVRARQAAVVAANAILQSTQSRNQEHL